MTIKKRPHRIKTGPHTYTTVGSNGVPTSQSMKVGKTTMTTLKGGGYRTTVNLGGGFVDVKTTKPIKQNFSGFGGAQSGHLKIKSGGLSSRPHQFKPHRVSRSGGGQIDIGLLLKAVFYIVGFIFLFYST